VERRERRVRRFVPASVAPCIPRDKLRRERVRWALDRLFPLLELRGRAAVRAGQRAVRGSVTFREA
jgi:hypothetical protein